MSEITAVKDRNGDILQIVAPGKSLGRGELLAANTTFTSLPTTTEAMYIFCTSVIHVAEGSVVTDSDAPVDARSGIYLRSNRGAVISVGLMEGEDAATVWIAEVK
ncbi:hypothetical protein [Pseudomonas fragi]|uniref:hypothetical protein n=1 Tax=Pseudomonas fragi TaxID=296 RepID=UPI000BA24D9D|nr:hypothetical protein [Pseudomonas fragi]PAA00060.1 hypothetical protein CJU76_22985 [Pseudomonas fragi]